MKHSLKYLLLSILLLLLISFTTLIWIVSTEIGLRFIVATVQQWTPGEFKIDTLQGRLLDKIHFTGLSYQYKDTKVQIASFQFTLEAKSLLNRTLQVKQLSIDGIKIDLPEAEENQKVTPLKKLPDIQLPLKITFDDVQINQITLKNPQAEPIIIDSIHLRSTTARALSLQHLQVKSPHFNAKLVGHIRLTSPHALQLKVNWSAQLPDDLTLVGQGQLIGDTNKLIFTHTISQPLAIVLKTTIEDVLDTLRIESQLTWQTFYWPFTKDHFIKSQQGHATLSGTLDQYNIYLKTSLLGKNIPEGNWKITAQGNRQALTITHLKLNTLHGVVKATGKVNWASQLTAELNLKAKQISLENFWKKWPKSLRVDSQLQAELKKNDLKINLLKVISPRTNTQLVFQGNATLAGKKTRVKKARLVWQNMQWPLIKSDSIAIGKTGRADLAGTLQDYQIDLKTQLAGTHIPPGVWTIKGQGNLQRFILESLHANLLKGVVSATGQVYWQPRLTAQLKLNTSQLPIKEVWGHWPEHLKVNSQLVAKLDGNNFFIKSLKVDLPKTTTQLSLQGNGTLAGEKTHFEGTLAWQDLHWPFTSPAKRAQSKTFFMSSKTGTLHAKGTLQDYQFSLKTHLKGKEIPSSRWKAVGVGNTQGLKLKNVQVKILQGHLSLTGFVNWFPQINWQLGLNGKAINPAHQWTAWPGKLALDIYNQGHLKNGTLETQIEVKGMEGKLRGYPVRLKTGIVIKNHSYKINQFHLKSGNADLRADGELGDHSKLDWAIDVPNFGTLLPTGKGRLKGKGQLTGRLKQPHITAQLTGHSLAFQNNHINTLRVKGELNLLGEQDLHLNMIATDLLLDAKPPIERWSVKAQGSVTHHTLKSQLIISKNHLLVKLKGGYQEAGWLGELKKFTLSTEKLSTWQLQAPAALTLSATEAKLTRSCLKSVLKTARFCTQVNWQKDANSHLQAHFKKLPLNFFQPFLPSQKTALTGTLNSTLKATLQPDNTLNSELMIKLSPGKITTYLADRKQKIIHHGGTVKVNINEKGLRADLKLGLLKQTGLQGTFKLPHLTQLPFNNKQQPMQGKVTATFADLNILPTFIPQAENTLGRVNMEVTLGGTLAKPKIQGRIAVHKARFDLPDLGLKIKRFNANFSSNRYDTLQIQARMHSGKGYLNVKGKSKLLSATRWKTDLKIQGKNFEVVNIPIAWALVSPNLNVSIVQNDIDVTGQVMIPEAILTPSTKKSDVVSVSEDVIIINSKKPVAKKENLSKNIVISSKVKMILGHQVSIKVADFHSRLEGSVVAHNQPGKETLGKGEVQIIEGIYKAYGQYLKIDRGRLIFTGGAIENPRLDIPAYRRIKQNSEDEIIAGVQIQGTAQSPQLTLFSKPSLDQSNILSYIILGKPIAQTSETEGQALLSTAVAMQLQEGDPLTNTIGKQLGLDTGLSSEGSIDETAFVVGKYLAPGLYISYGIGLFDGSKIWRMRYQLNRQLTLETETGTQSGIDLRYSIER